MAVILGIGGLEGLEVLTPKTWKSFILMLLIMSATRILISLLFEFILARMLKKNEKERGTKREQRELIQIKKKLKERVERLRKNSKQSTN